MKDYGRQKRLPGTGCSMNNKNEFQQNCNRMSPFNLLAIVDEESTVNDVDQNIEKLRNYGSGIIIGCGSFCLTDQRNIKFPFEANLSSLLLLFPKPRFPITYSNKLLLEPTLAFRSPITMITLPLESPSWTVMNFP